jgi:acylphosphatase
MKKRIGAVVEGRVQGVGFRFFVQELADRYNLSGWVRNTLDGNVELEAQGSVSEVAAFVEKLPEGPPHAYVTGVRSYEMPFDEGEREFVIRH